MRTEWRKYYDDYGEPPQDDDPGRPGTWLVAPYPFEGDKIVADGLREVEADEIVAALNRHPAPDFRFLVGGERH